MKSVKVKVVGNGLKSNGVVSEFPEEASNLHNRPFFSPWSEKSETESKQLLALQECYTCCLCMQMSSSVH